MNRRRFFNSLAKAAAIVALAPQLAFRVKPIIISPARIIEELNMGAFSSKVPGFYDFLRAQKPYTWEELEATPIRHRSNVSGCKINSLNEHELRSLFS